MADGDSVHIYGTVRGFRGGKVLSGKGRTEKGGRIKDQEGWNSPRTKFALLSDN